MAAFHPEAARKANLASGDRRTTGMSFFSIGGGLGFAVAPAITMALVVPGARRGCCAPLIPTALIAALSSAGSASRPPRPTQARGGRSPHGRDDWRAFGILSGATVSRSIVFYGLNTFLALYFMGRWQQTAAEASRASVVFLGTSIVGTLLGGWLADRFGRREVIRIGFTGATVFLTLFLSTSDPTWAMAILVPLAVFLFLPTSVLVVLGQEYLPQPRGTGLGRDARPGRERRRDVRAAPGPAWGPVRHGARGRDPAGHAGDGGGADVRPAARRPLASPRRHGTTSTSCCPSRPIDEQRQVVAAPRRRAGRDASASDR